MPAASNYYGDVYNWLFKMIDSCTKREQKQSIFKMITLFEQKYMNSRPYLIWTDFDFNKSIAKMSDELRTKTLLKFGHLESAKYIEEQAK